MSKKKRSGVSGGTSAKGTSRTSRQTRPAEASSGRRKSLLIAGAAVLLVAFIAIIASGGSRSGSQGGATNLGAAPPEEAKYIGRFLPAGYQEANVGGGIFSGARKMVPVAAVVSSTGIVVPVADVKKDRIVSFKYAKSSGENIPLVAYVKPSGKLFVGVSFCVPCQGEGQDIGSDGTLTCQSCGTKRDLESGIGISGACKLYPLDELPAKVVGDKITVQKAALDSWTVQPLDRKVGG